MTEQNQSSTELDLDCYVHTQTRLRKLGSHLPEELVKDLAAEVIRRLAETHVDATPLPPSDDQIEHLCHALLSDDDTAGAQFISDARSEGVSVTSIYLNYLAGAARMLGKWWEEDHVSFMDVTRGTSRMYAIMRALRHSFAPASSSLTKIAVFASVPGETHILGVRMAADLFRKVGWDIELKIGKTHDELVAEIMQSEATVIGLSASGARSVKPLSRLVLALRIGKPTAAIFVSGNIITEEEDTIALLDIDGMVTDIEAAKVLATAHLEAQVEKPRPV